ncbi:MAG TPA: carbohydrate kinase family protein [Bryobacteraceae bacterium]|jgi:sugar/nucleoside kinase (ribokinase family)
MTHNTKVSVCVCGNIVFDVLVRPVEQLRWAATTLVDTVTQQLGGNAGSTSYTLAKLGIPTFVVTLVGRDHEATAILSRLESAGVDTARVMRVDVPTSVAISLVNQSGERALLYQLGASAAEFPSFPISGADHFHLAAVFRMKHLRTAAPAVLRHARELGMTTSVDTQWDTEDEWMKVLAPSLPFTDLLFVNEDEARMLTDHTDPGSAARALQDAGAKTVCVKLGPKGCAIFSADQEFTSPGFRVNAIDSTGAGDCFSAGYIAALQRNLSHPHAARFANAVGAMSVQKLGATAGIVDWQETRTWMDQQDAREDGFMLIEP